MIFGSAAPMMLKRAPNIRKPPTRSQKSLRVRVVFSDSMAFSSIGQRPGCGSRMAQPPPPPRRYRLRHGLRHRRCGASEIVIYQVRVFPHPFKEAGDRRAVAVYEEILLRARPHVRPRRRLRRRAGRHRIGVGEDAARGPRSPARGCRCPAGPCVEDAAVDEDPPGRRLPHGGRSEERARARGRRRAGRRLLPRRACARRGELRDMPPHRSQGAGKRPPAPRATRERRRVPVMHEACITCHTSGGKGPHDLQRVPYGHRRRARRGSCASSSYDLLRGPLFIAAWVIFALGFAWRIFQFRRMTSRIGRPAAPAVPVATARDTEFLTRGRTLPGRLWLRVRQWLRRTVFGTNPVMGVVSLLFHLLLVLVPLLLPAHAILFRQTFHLESPDAPRAAPGPCHARRARHRRLLPGAPHLLPPRARPVDGPRLSHPAPRGGAVLHRLRGRTTSGSTTGPC